MTTTRREFTEEFKREAVLLLESSGRPLMQVAKEFGIQPLMRRNWRARGHGPAGLAAGQGGTGKVLLPASPEQAKIRKELERARMERDILAPGPNRVWLADMTYIPTREGWLYLAIVLDLFSRKVVGWAMRETMAQELTIAALQMAITNRRPSPELPLHSDRGSQYAAHDYRRQLARHGMLCSMSRKGDCWDNVPMESFFGSLKIELEEDGPFPAGQAARSALFTFIEAFYSRTRLHSAIGYKAPTDMEQLAAAA